MPYPGQFSPSGNEQWDGAQWVRAPGVDTGVDGPVDQGAVQAAVAQSGRGLYGANDYRYAAGAMNPAGAAYYAPGGGQDIAASNRQQRPTGVGPGPMMSGGGRTNWQPQGAAGADGTTYLRDPVTGATAIADRYGNVSRDGGRTYTETWSPQAQTPQTAGPDTMQRPQGIGPGPTMEQPYGYPRQPRYPGRGGGGRGGYGGGRGGYGSGGGLVPDMYARPRTGPMMEQPAAQPARQEVPLPWQVRPDVWSGLGPVGQGLARGAAGQGGWDAGDYEYRMKRSWPTGQAPRSVNYGYAQPRGDRGMG